MQSGWAIGALFAAAISALVLERFGWRVLFLFGALPAFAAFVIRRTVEEPEVWKRSAGLREMRGGRTYSGRAPATRTIVATLLASSVLVAFWA